MYAAPGLAHKNLLTHLHALSSCSWWILVTLEAKGEDGGVMRWKELGLELPLGGELRGDLEHPP